MKKLLKIFFAVALSLGIVLFTSNMASAANVNTIDATVSRYNEDRATNVETGLQEEINSLKEAREAFVTELEGTGTVGRE
jgi:peptidoglycan hydrolase CwlO-like protein